MSVPPVLNNREPVLKNLKIAIKFLQGAKPEEIALSNWCQRTPCGTLFCAGGWLATQKYFQDQGLVLVVPESKFSRIGLYYKGKNLSGQEWSSSILDDLLGPQGFTLLMPRGSNELDYMHLGYQDEQGKPILRPPGHLGTHVDDRTLAIRRFQWAYKVEHGRQAQLAGGTL